MTTYPGSLDSFTNPLSTDTLATAGGSTAVPHASQHANLNDAVLAIQTALGANLANVVLPARSISTTAPLTGGGGLSANRTLSLNIGSSLTTSTSNLIVDSTVVPYLANANTFTQPLTANSFIPTSSTVPANGIYLPSGNQIGFATNSTGSRLLIDALGQVSLGGATNSANLNLVKNITGATLYYGIRNFGVIQSDVTGTVYLHRTIASTAAASFTLTNLIHQEAFQSTFGAGSTVNNQFGFRVDSSMTGATNNYGFFGNLTAASNVWNFYTNGTAANYFAGQTTVGSTSLTLGSGSVAQQLGVVSGAATTVGAVIRGAASQTADLQQWQNSSGTVVSSVRNDGVIVANTGLLATGAAVWAGSYIANTQLASTPNSATVVGAIIRAAASQTANLQEWQNSAGTVLASIDSTGQLATPNINMGNLGGIYNASNGSYILFTYTAATFIPYGPTRVGVIVKGAASQTANLQEWQNSSGTVLASIDATGQGTFKSTTVTASSAAGVALTLVAASGQTANLLETAGGARITAAGNYFSAPGITARYTADFTAGAANVVAVTVVGAASQTANLQEWRSSAGTVLASIDSSGNVGIGTSSPSTYSSAYKTVNAIKNTDQLITTGAYWQSGIGQFAFINSSNADGVTGQPLVFQRGSSESMRIDSAGLVGIGTAPSGAMLHVVNNTAGNVGTIIKGAASQTGDLLQIQNSAGTKSVFVDANGALGIGVTAVASGQALEVAANGSTGVYPVRFTNLNTGSNTTKLAGILFGGYDTASASKPTGDISVGPSDSNYVTSFMRFSTRTSDVVTERMRIDSSGNVGIGTTTPSGKLDVSGTINILDGSSSFTVPSNSVGGGGVIFRGDSNSASRWFQIVSNTSAYGLLDFTASSTNANTGLTSKMVLTSTGNLGIGTTTPAAKLDVNGSINATNYNMAGKNYIINGGFDYWQRATSGTYAGSAPANYLADRWLVGTQTGAGVQQEVISQVVDSTTGENYMQLTQYKASGFSGGFSRLITIIEASQTTFLRGQTVTLSWQAATPATANGTTAVPYTGSWYVFANYDTNDSTINQGAFTSTDASIVGTGITSSLWRAGGVTSTSWTTYSMTFTVPTNARRLSIGFFNNNTSGSNNSALMFRRVQLELGSTATPFSRAGGTIDGELAACQRYYYRTATGTTLQNIGQGFAKSTTVVLAQVQLPVTMRSNPSTSIDAANLAVYNGTTSAVSSATVATIATSPNCVTVDCTGTGFTINTPYQLLTNTTAAYIGFSAEL